MIQPIDYLLIQVIFILVYPIILYLLINSFRCLRNLKNSLIRILNMDDWHSAEEFLSFVSVGIVSVLIWWIDYTLWLPVVVIAGGIFGIILLAALCTHIGILVKYQK